MKSSNNMTSEQFLKNSIIQLYKEYTNACYTYNIRLNPVSIMIKDLHSCFGYWCPNTRSITISKNLIINHSWSIVIEVLKHEMAHQYVSEVLHSNDCHKKDFQTACHLLRIKPWARKATIALDEIDFKKNKFLDDTEKKIIRWTTKLLALGTSTNKKESFSALEKVKRLNHKYNIKQLLNKKEKHYSTLIINHQKKRIENFQVIIGNILINHFMVKIIYSSLYNPKKGIEEKTIEIIGTEANIEIAEYVYWFLYNQIQFFWADFKKNYKLKGVREKHNFFQGILDGFEYQLSQKKSEPTKKYHTKIKPSLIELKGEQELISYINYTYPKLSKTHQTVSRQIDRCYREGKKIGYQLTLKKGLKKHTQNSIKLIK